MGYHGEKGGIPRVVKDTIQFLRDSGMFLPQYAEQCHNYGSIRLDGSRFIQTITFFSYATSCSRRL